MSLLLDVSGLEREVGREMPVRLEGRFPGGDLPSGVEFGPVTIEGRAVWTGQSVLVEGTAGADVELVCGRCLKPFSRRVEARVTSEHRPVDALGESDAAPGRRAVRGRRGRRAGPPPDGPSKPSSAEAGFEAPEAPLPFAGDVIDLGFPAWEALVLELPMKPMCRRDCRGLCALCGADLNETRCGCRADEPDPRLAALGKLLRAKERSEE